MEMFERFYPSSESILIGRVPDCELFGYIFYGFALFTDGKKGVYSSYNLFRSELYIPQTPETDEVFRPKKENENNVSGLIKLHAKLKHIQYHYGDSPDSWNLIKKVLSDKEYESTLENYKTTIDSMIGIMFPNYTMA